MKLILDESFIELGIKNIVAARVYNISSTIKLDDKFINKLKAKEKVARTLILATFIGLKSSLVKTKLDDA